MRKNKRRNKKPTSRLSEIKYRAQNFASNRKLIKEINSFNQFILKKIKQTEAMLDNEGCVKSILFASCDEILNLLTCKIDNCTTIVEASNYFHQLAGRVLYIKCCYHERYEPNEAEHLHFLENIHELLYDPASINCEIIPIFPANEIKEAIKKRNLYQKNFDKLDQRVTTLVSQEKYELAKNSIEQGIEELEQLDKPQTSLLLRTTLKDKHKIAYLKYMLGIVLIRLNNFPEAEKALEIAYKNHIHDAAIQLVPLYFNSKQLTKAISLLKHLIFTLRSALNPSHYRRLIAQATGLLLEGYYFLSRQQHTSKKNLERISPITTEMLKYAELAILNGNPIGYFYQGYLSQNYQEIKKNFEKFINIVTSSQDHAHPYAKTFNQELIISHKNLALFQQPTAYEDRTTYCQHLLAALKLGDASAAAYLGSFYKNHPTTPNLVLAEKFYAKAIALGDTHSVLEIIDLHIKKETSKNSTFSLKEKQSELVRLIDLVKEEVPAAYYTLYLALLYGYFTENLPFPWSGDDYLENQFYLTCAWSLCTEDLKDKQLTVNNQSLTTMTKSIEASKYALLLATVLIQNSALNQAITLLTSLPTLTQSKSSAHLLSTAYFLKSEKEKDSHQKEKFRALSESYEKEAKNLAESPYPVRFMPIQVDKDMAESKQLCQQAARPENKDSHKAIQQEFHKTSKRFLTNTNTLIAQAKSSPPHHFPLNPAAVSELIFFLGIEARRRAANKFVFSTLKGENLIWLFEKAKAISPDFSNAQLANACDGLSKLGLHPNLKELYNLYNTLYKLAVTRIYRLPPKEFEMIFTSLSRIKLPSPMLSMFLTQFILHYQRQDKTSSDDLFTKLPSLLYACALFDLEEFNSPKLDERFKRFVTHLLTDTVTHLQTLPLSSQSLHKLLMAVTYFKLSQHHQLNLAALNQIQTHLYQHLQAHSAAQVEGSNSTSETLLPTTPDQKLLSLNNYFEPLESEEISFRAAALSPTISNPQKKLFDFLCAYFPSTQEEVLHPNCNIPIDIALSYQALTGIQQEEDRLYLQVDGPSHHLRDMQGQRICDTPKTDLNSAILRDLIRITCDEINDCQEGQEKSINANKMFNLINKKLVEKGLHPIPPSKRGSPRLPSTLFLRASSEKKPTTPEEKKSYTNPPPVYH